MTSLALVVVIDGVAAVVELAVLRPAEASSARADATPLNSATLALAALAADRVTVALLTGDAPVVYHSSTRVFDPVRKPAGPFVQALPAESVTLATAALLPACIAMAATSASPGVEAISTSNVVPAAVAPVPWRTNAGPAGLSVGVVTGAAAVAAVLPAASKAATL